MWMPGDMRARMIRAAADREREPKVGTPEATIQCVGTVEWLGAAESGKDQPKKFSLVGYTGGAMQVGLYYRPVVIDLAGLTAAADEIPALLGHDTDRIVGHGTPEISATRVKMSGVVSGGGEAAKEVLESAGNGFPWKASVGVAPTSREFVDEGATARANGRTWKGPINIVRSGVLGEISFVPIAADSRTSVSVAASQQEPAMDKQFRKWLEAKGFEPDKLTDDMIAPLKAAYDAEQTPAPEKKKPQKRVEGAGDEFEPDKVVGEIRAKAAAELERIEGIRQACDGKHGDIEAKATKEGWTVEKCELEVLRASRSTPPAGHVHGTPACSERVLEAAMCQALQIHDLDKQYDDQTLQAAHTQFSGQIGLQEILLIAARQNGYTRGAMRIRRGNVREVLQAAFSTVSISNVLANVQNKLLLAAFMKVEDTWRRVGRIGQLSDFKPHKRYRLTSDLTYQELSAGGEIAHGTLGDEDYSITGTTYARMLAITRKDIVNDDLGALDSIPRTMGRGAALRINTSFWTEFLADAVTFFTTARGNFFDGGASALDSSSLSIAVQMFREQTDGTTDADGTGHPIAVEPAILLTPPALEATAQELYVSRAINTGGSSTKAKVPNSNIHAGKFRPEVSAYLSNSKLTGYSSLAWYLLADPDDLPMIEIAFLDGQQVPTIESADADFNQLGIQVRGYHDFGVAKQDHRAAVKSKGEA